MPEYFDREEAMQRQQQSYRSKPKRTTNRRGDIIEVPPRTGKVICMVPADCWLVGVVWADSEGVEFLDKDDFERLFES
jgi:hypothetical protein